MENNTELDILSHQWFEAKELEKKAKKRRAEIESKILSINKKLIKESQKKTIQVTPNLKIKRQVKTIYDESILYSLLEKYKKNNLVESFPFQIEYEYKPLDDKMREAEKIEEVKNILIRARIVKENKPTFEYIENVSDK